MQEKTFSAAKSSQMIVLLVHYTTGIQPYMYLLQQALTSKHDSSPNPNLHGFDLLRKEAR
ncbi:hypothetical protein N7491_003902 [Penicillium cf. griseofulvum]|uniref:Uncharacterized protein n=1 Tax=Penicillium cf. griseofulvum TaxID=2972120 RepID=A0A9W9T125_9EURO|nr:hypothetical protein N7472_001920 [Penicillium cf. griseofulvum]KAJ5437349.1 hypothetical protein N7445_005893 [Penicillium cf. griseofulvum]KAJ5441496.1 hypothetical protein N7491_003902 [Penicillium cf. griseofulvum]